MKKLISAAIIAAILGTGYFYFINGDPMAQEQKQTTAPPDRKSVV